MSPPLLSGEGAGGRGGSRFFFSLTLPTGKQTSTSEGEIDWSLVQHLSDDHSVDALVVDDIKENRDILEQMLSAIGVNVKTAENGEVALEQVAEHMPDIVFMDVRMPVMDGPETLVQIFDLYGRGATVVVAVTASVFDHQRKEYLDLGFDNFIDKPLRAEQVYEKLAQYLNVTYTFAEEQTETSVEMDWTSISLPSELHQNLLEAVEEHSITQLRQQLSELEALGEATQPLAKHLSGLAQKIDMAGIKGVLEEIRTQS